MKPLGALPVGFALLVAFRVLFFAAFRSAMVCVDLGESAEDDGRRRQRRERAYRPYNAVSSAFASRCAWMLNPMNAAVAWGGMSIFSTFSA